MQDKQQRLVQSRGPANTRHALYQAAPMLVFYSILWPTSTSNVAPAGDPGVNATEEGAIWGSQADGCNEVGKSHWWRQPQEGDVVVASIWVVVRMKDDLWHCPRHLIRVWSFLTLTTQKHSQARWVVTEIRRRDILKVHPPCFTQHLNLFLK